MLTAALNHKLTHIEPGSATGDLLRRYWHPVAGASELDQASVKPIRLFGEDLVLYRDLSGNHGLVERQCAHRRADLSYGFVEAEGLRCNYHGWRYAADGDCIDRPYDDTAKPALARRGCVKIKAYPVEEKAGLLWAYMGPSPAPLIPDWEPFGWANGFVQIVKTEVPCNWLQCQENSIDPVHFEWMHDNWSKRQQGSNEPYAPPHKELAFEEFDFGLVYKRLRGDATKDDEMWTIGRVCLWPNAFFLGDHFEWRVPIDDENTLSVTWAFTRVPAESEPFVQKRIPTWNSPLKDEGTGRWITSHVINQDYVAWVGQGRIADRTKEKLSAGDAGIVLLRRQILANLQRIADGLEPMGIIRDPQRNKNVALPIVNRTLYERALTLDQWKRNPQRRRHLQGFVFCYGQPSEVRAEFAEAMGIEPEWSAD